LSATPPSSTPPPGAKPLWGSGEGLSPAEAQRAVARKWPDSPQKRHAPGGEPLDPLSRRLLQAAGVLALLLILVVANSFVNGEGESPLDPNPVAAAAERTQEVEGMRIEMTMRFRSESSPPVTVTGTGAYNGETNLAEIAYDGTTTQGQRIAFDAILGEDGWYFHYPQLAGRLPDGKEWVKLEGFPGQEDLSAPGVASPEESLQVLRAAGTVRRLGRSSIDGVSTTRYQVTLMAAEIASALRAQGKVELADELDRVASQMVGPVESEVFVDRDGVVRRMRMVSTSISDGKRVTSSMRMDFSDFGIEPEVLIPEDSQVFDITPLLEGQLDALGQAG
jgi:hypothetical protein